MSHFRTTPISLCLLMVVFANARSAELTKESLETVHKNIADKKAVLVDVREKSEWDLGHIEGAIFLPLTKLQQKVDTIALAKLLPKDKIIYTHCVAGVRSVTAGSILEKLGYEVRPLKPGYKELVDFGFKKDEGKQK
jgi:phage shock protein E